MGIVLCIFSLWVVSVVLSLAVWPIVSLLFGNFSDKGYAFSRGIGLTIVSFTSFLFATLKIIPLGFWSLAVIVILYGFFHGWDYVRT